MSAKRKNEERKLINSLKRGDKSYFNSFYKTGRKEFLSWSKRNYKIPQEDAIDIYQNASILLYEKIVGNQLDHLQSSLKTYFYGIAKNLIARYFREGKKEIDHQDNLQEHWLYQTKSEDENAQEMRKLISEQVNKLGEPCKSILKLFYFDNLSMDQIAQRLQYKSAGVAKTQKSRCMQQLKKEVTKQMQLKLNSNHGK